MRNDKAETSFLSILCHKKIIVCLELNTGLKLYGSILSFDQNTICLHSSTKETIQTISKYTIIFIVPCVEAKKDEKRGSLFRRKRRFNKALKCVSD